MVYVFPFCSVVPPFIVALMLESDEIISCSPTLRDIDVFNVPRVKIND